MANPNDTTENYFDFVCHTMGDLHDAMAILAGARSLFCETCDIEAGTSLAQVRTLLRHLDERLDQIALRLDESTFDYEPKKKTLEDLAA